jgi:glucose-fructose oxidoreductase
MQNEHTPADAQPTEPRREHQQAAPGHETGGGADRRVRYAVVGLGHIAQVAVLPAFRHAAENSLLTALVSGDARKRKALGRKHKVRTYSYEEYDECLHSGDVDAVYIALPNNMHCEYAVRAAEAGKHVLCEKPMAVTEDECLKMISAAEANDVKLMIAYRLHFEETNLEALEIAKSGTLGDLRYFLSTFSLQVKEGNIRTQEDLGGGTLYDIGVYCINAARTLFQDEPIEVFSASANNGDPRFEGIDEMTAAVLRFPGERLASFISSFGAADTSVYHLVGTKGDIRLEPAYAYAEKLAYQLTVEGKKKKKTTPKRDQFAPELLYFSKCVLDGTSPEPSGLEGLADVRIIEALYRSGKEGRALRVEPVEKPKRPAPSQEIERPPVSPPELIEVESPHH